ncbi:MAG: response regulator [Pseudomonadota bacterium]
MIYEGRHFVLVEDDATMGQSLVQRLELEGARVTWVKQMVRGISAVRTPHHPVDAVVCDIRLPDGTGEDLFQTISKTTVPPPFLFITGQGEIDQAVRLLRAGAADYVTKPFEMPAFLDRLATIVQTDAEDDASLGLTGVSPLARRIDAQIADIAATDHHVLIKGQRGLGKGRVARRIHETSDRRLGRLLPVNGFERQDLSAAIAQVGDGTLVLSAIDQLSDEDQGTLFSALRGSTFRLIASAPPEIEAQVARGAFREDLYFALVASEIVIPPLHQRPEDAVWLAQQFFSMMNKQRSEPLKGLSELSVAVLREHDWPGNGREVRARLVRAIGVAQGDWIFPVDLFPELSEAPNTFETLAETRDAAERRQILRALELTEGQMVDAARLLGVSRTTLWEKMQKHDL